MMKSIFIFIICIHALIINSKYCVFFSVVCDMGSASFKYDMRRLTELLAFPKAWYRKKIVRRLFLGEEGPSAPEEEQFSSGMYQGQLECS